MAPTTEMKKAAPNMTSTSSSQENMAQLPKLVATSSNTTSSTPRVLKRKMATEKDMFKTNKRPKYNTSNKANFEQEYQREQQKIRDELPIRPDMLEGIIIPPQRLSSGINGAFNGKTTQGDPGKLYRYAARHGDKARVKQGLHVSQQVRDRALATFPKLEQRKKEEAVAKAKERVERRASMLEEIGDLIEKYGNKVKVDTKVNSGEENDVLETRFIHQCWKNVNYAARFQVGAVQHRDVKRYSQEFVSTSELTNWGLLAHKEAAAKMGSGTELSALASMD